MPEIISNIDNFKVVLILSCFAGHPVSGSIKKSYLHWVHPSLLLQQENEDEYPAQLAAQLQPSQAYQRYILDTICLALETFPSGKSWNFP